VVIIGSPDVNPGYKLVNNSAYSQIAQDFETTFRVLKSLHCDIFLGAHGSYYGMIVKHRRLKAGGRNPFVDPEGYKKYVARKRAGFPRRTKKAIWELIYGLALRH
jgi:metallo-beta-lactamase class B